MCSTLKAILHQLLKKITAAALTLRLHSSNPAITHWGGLWWSTPACSKNNNQAGGLGDHSWWIPAAVSLLPCWDSEASSCLHDHDGTDRLRRVREQKEACAKLEIRLHAQTCQSQRTTHAGSQPRWGGSHASGQTLKMEMKPLRTRSYWAEDLRGLENN